MSAKNFRKFIVTFLLSLGVFIGISSFTGNVVSAEENNDDTFVLGFDAEFPPYGYRDSNGEYVGFDLDLAQEVCNRNGWKFVKQPIDWDTKDMELNSGIIDCIWNGFTIDGREDAYTFSEPYIDNSQVVVVKKGSGITKLSDLAGKHMIVQADSSALAAFTGEDATKKNKDLAYSFASLQQVPDYNTAFMNLEAGAADAVCLDMGVASYEVANRGDKFTVLSEHVSSEKYAVGFKKGNTELRDKVQASLNEMVADGTLDKIADKWGLTESICLGKESKSGAKVDVKTDIPASSSTKINFGDMIRQISKGMGRSVAIFLLTLLFSIPLGLCITFVRRSKIGVFRWIARVYISILRGTPLMLQLIVAFYGPYYLFGLALSPDTRFRAVIIAFTLNYAAYFAEIFRGGLEGIPVGQSEAAKVLGYNKWQTFWKILFPQMVKRVMPTVTNETITLVKDTSLSYAIAYTEMFTIAKQVAANQSSIIALFVAGVFYYIFNAIVEFVMGRIEKKLNYFN